MPLLIHPSVIKALHSELVDIYRGRELPYEITDGYNSEGLIDACVDLAFRETLMEEPLYTDVLQMATVLFYHLIITHPFIDGNKRTALCTLYFFLLWNGYYLEIPKNAADFVIDVATPSKNITIDKVHEWIRRNSKSYVGTKIRSSLLMLLIKAHTILESRITHILLGYFMFRPLPGFLLEAIERTRTVHSSRRTQKKLLQK